MLERFESRIVVECLVHVNKFIIHGDARKACDFVDFY